MDTTMKQCPECAEDVREAALKCRYCEYRFEAEPTVSLSRIDAPIDAPKVLQTQQGATAPALPEAGEFDFALAWHADQRPRHRAIRTRDRAIRTCASLVEQETAGACRMSEPTPASQREGHHAAQVGNGFGCGRSFDHRAGRMMS
jgi:Uncharacterised protein family UPF0547